METTPPGDNPLTENTPEGNPADPREGKEYGLVSVFR